MSTYWPLRFIFLLFVSPMIAAAYLLIYKDPHSFKTVQHGTLIQPGQHLKLHNLTLEPNIWHVIYVTPEICSSSCLNQQQVLAKLQAALGASRHRVNIINAQSNMLYPIQKDDSMLIIDPFGQYVMYYAPGTKPSGLLKDLKRLLKYSHV